MYVYLYQQSQKLLVCSFFFFFLLFNFMSRSGFVNTSSGLELYLIFMSWDRTRLFFGWLNDRTLELSLVYRYSLIVGYFIVWL